MSINKTFLIGNLGTDVEKKYLQSGTCAASFSVATSEKWKKKDSGESQERTDWHRIKALGKSAELCAQYLKKGSKVFLSGRIRNDKFTDKNGVEKYASYIFLDEVQFLSPKVS